MNDVSAAITGLPPEENNRRLMSPVRFVLFFIFLYGAAVLIPEQALAPVNRLFAKGSAYLLETWGLSATVQGDTIIAGGFHARVIDECTPLFMLILFLSFLAAYPAQLQRRMKALLLATLFFSCLTIVRIAFLVFVGARYTAQFSIVHTYLAQSLMALAVILAALFWLRWEQGAIAELPIPGFLFRFILWSSFLFLAWLPVNKLYMQQIDHLLIFIFSLFGQQLVTPYSHTVYFQTFNLVTFGALMLASHLPAGVRDRICLAIGLAVLIFGHLLVRLGNIITTAFNLPWGFSFATSISLLGQYLAPFLLWWIMVYGRGKEEQTA